MTSITLGIGFINGRATGKSFWLGGDSDSAFSYIVAGHMSNEKLFPGDA